MRWPSRLYNGGGGGGGDDGSGREEGETKKKKNGKKINKKVFWSFQQDPQSNNYDH